MTYQIVNVSVTGTAAEGVAALQTAVATQVSAGYVPVGGIVVIEDKLNERQVLAQAMTHT